MKTFGMIYVVEKGCDVYGKTYNRASIVIDAEPHVMSTVRRIFAHGNNELAAGRFTHKVVSVALNNANARDVIWVADRYPMEYQDGAKERLSSMADAYEKTLKAVSTADQDAQERFSPGAATPAVKLREHQVRFVNMANTMKRLLLADSMGLGKTISALGTLAEPDSRPAIVVCPPHLCLQWAREINRVYPKFSTHLIHGFKTYDLPEVDVIITSYNRLGPWEDILFQKTFNTVIFDEVHDLRKTGTAKRQYSRLLSEKASRCFGLSGTPIFNYGIEIWSVLDVVKPGCLESEKEFSSEWCVWDKVREPAVLSSFLKSQGLMLRRTPNEVGLNFGTASKHVYTLDADLKTLTELNNVMKTLALSILSAKVGEADISEKEFDYKLRQATGIAKAKSAAQFVKMMCEQGEKVLLAGWHRDVYSIWLEELAEYDPVMFTGTESPAEKAKSVKRFMEEDSCKVFIISLRSGAGLDGLQFVCNNVVFGELDWSPHVMDQVVMRLDRDGQRNHVQAYYLTINDGSDPFIMNILNIKRSQHEGVVDGENADAALLEGQAIDPTRVREMAKAYLEKLGEEIPEAVPEIGALGDVAAVLRRVKVPSNTEEELQEALWKILPGALPELSVEREVKVGKKSRLDFLVSGDSERIAIECKVTQTDRAAVYRQVRKYIKEANITALILFAPWFGIQSFVVDNIPVIVVDFTKNSI